MQGLTDHVTITFIFFILKAYPPFSKRADPDDGKEVWVEDPDCLDRQIDTEQWEAQVYLLARRIPSVLIPNRPRGVMDRNDVFDDWISIYDKSDWKGFYMAIGTSGNQFKNAPVVGHLMAELIEGFKRGRDHDREPVQVKCRYTGLVLNADSIPDFVKSIPTAASLSADNPPSG